MTNSDIADTIKLYADLYELHGGNPFKIKSYSVAAFRIDKMPEQLAGKTVPELEKMEGIGKNLAAKIYEIHTTSSFTELNDLLSDTPEGVLAMMKIKGIGPKKIAYLWKEGGIDSVGELLYACRENRIAQAKGFGLKTQQSIIRQIEFMFASANLFHYARLEPLALTLLEDVTKLGAEEASFCGELRRKCEVLDRITIIASVNDTEAWSQQLVGANLLINPTVSADSVHGFVLDTIPVTVYHASTETYVQKLVELTGSAAHLEQIGFEKGSGNSEISFYGSLGLPLVEPEMREGLGEVDKARNGKLPQLITTADLKGILHNHSTWSDGLNTLEEMAQYCKELGYEYLGMCDHSKSAFYANGLKEDRILLQHAEIDALNAKMAPFKIFKGIESDILNDGSLDYSNDLLASFDFIVASIHSNLKMPEEKAMHRLIRAIENPFTTILGHPTGRLLLMREGYPVDHAKMIDACAANGVVIEINANPYRLDLDWRWIDYALNKGVMLSINPDAHEKEGYHDMHFGVCAARKGGLTKEMCFNSLSLAEISAHFDKRKNSR